MIQMAPMRRDIAERVWQRQSVGECLLRGLGSQKETAHGKVDCPFVIGLCTSPRVALPTCSTLHHTWQASLYGTVGFFVCCVQLHDLITNNQ